MLHDAVACCVINLTESEGQKSGKSDCNEDGVNIQSVQGARGVYFYFSQKSGKHLK